MHTNQDLTGPKHKEMNFEKHKKYSNVYPNMLYLRALSLGHISDMGGSGTVFFPFLCCLLSPSAAIWAWCVH